MNFFILHLHYFCLKVFNQSQPDLIQIKKKNLPHIYTVYIQYTYNSV